MPTSQVNEVIRYLRRTVLLPDGAAMTDGQLLSRFIDAQDEDAFAALVKRHAPMVWSVCCRVLANHHDAEDAFQATFLVLVRKAATVLPREMLPNWLYGVAAMTAHRAKVAAAIARRRERQFVSMPEPAMAESDLWTDLRPLLDQELTRLPDPYRVVVILCDLEGKTRKEAARQLGLPEGTVASRLARARVMLAKRLGRQGLGVSGGALAAVMTAKAVSASVPSSLVASTIKTASLLAVGQAAAGIISLQVAALTEGVVKTMFLTKLKITTVVLVAIALASAIGGGSYTVLQARPTDGSAPVPSSQNKEQLTDKEWPALSRALFRPELKTDKETLQGTWKLVATHKHGKKVDPTDIPIHPHDLVIEGSKVETKLSKGGGDRGKLELNPAASPKEITITWLIQWRGIYKLDEDKLTICFNPDNGIRPDGFTTSADSGRVLFVYERVKRRPNAKDQETEKEGFTAWGMEVGGLQAGLSFRPGEHRAYNHGETVRLVVRVRNVGKGTVKFEYLKQFLDENPPTVTDADGKTVPQEEFPVMTLAPRHAPVEVTLAPGREIVLESSIDGASGVRHELKPATGKGKPTDGEYRGRPLYGTGKVSVQYDRLFGNSSKGRIKLDPTLSKLTTGKLELEIKPDPPARPVGKTDKQVKSDEEQLQGTWKIVSTVDGGEKVKETGEWTFKDMKIKTVTQRSGMKLWGHIRFQINSRTKPKEFDVVAEGVGDDDSLLELASSGWEMDRRFFNEARMQGIYSIEGDTLKICISRNSDERPTAFKEGPLYISMTFQKVSAKVQADALQFLQKTQGDAEKLEKRNNAIHDEMLAMQKKAAAAAVAFEYPDAKRLDAIGANAGVTYAGAIYQSLSTTKDDLAKVAKWYDRKLAGLLAGQPAGAEGVGGEKDRTRRAVSQDGERPELDAIAKRPLSARSYLVRTKSYTISVVLSHPPGEALTVISLTYMPE
jgi:RNA polymerase sigma factor (sigma-70 family)